MNMRAFLGWLLSSTLLLYTLWPAGWAAATPLQQAQPHLVAHWAMDEGQGTVVSDSSGNGNNGTFSYTPSEWAAGYIGPHALKVGVNGSNVGVPASPSMHRLSAAQQFTFAFWLYFEPEAVYQTIFGQFINDSNLFRLSKSGENRIELQVGGAPISSDRVLAAGRWDHVAVSFDQGTIEFFLNGAWIGRVETSNVLLQSDNTFEFALFGGSAGVTLDDFRIYDTVLSGDAIFALADMFNPETEPPSVPLLTAMGKNDRALNLHWEPSTDNHVVVGYEIRQDGATQGTVAHSFYTARGLEPGRSYTFEARAIDKSGNYSDWSEPLTVRTAASGSVDYSPLGINLNGLYDYSPELPFVDLFKNSREWASDQPYPLDLDEHGWVRSLQPGQDAYTYLAIGLPYYPTGRYTLLYDGQGVIEVDAHRDATIVSSQPGQILFDVQTPTDAGLRVIIRSTDPADYIRNIRVIMPGFVDTYEEQPFNPVFLEKLAPFKVLRFMDWMRTNNNPVVSWSDRTTRLTATQAHEHGVSVEYMVELANTLHIDPWFTMPTRADDNYIRQFAAYVRDFLDPSLTAYIEYSNEVWNSSFVQYEYAVQQGLALGFTGSNHDAQFKYHGHRSRQIFEIWEDVFGGTERLKRVIGSFAYDSGYGAELSLSQSNAYEKTDAVAIAPYFAGSYGSEKAEFVKSASMEQIFEDFESELTLAKRGTAYVHQLVSSFDIELIAYEGGQHLAGGFYEGTYYPDDDELTAKFIAINRDSRMKAIYKRYLDDWKQSGGHMFVLFSFAGQYSKWGSWGILEYIYQPTETAPKYMALAEWALDNPIWWQADTETGDVWPPAAPAQVNALAGNESAAVSWTPVAGAESYELYMHAGASAPASPDDWQLVQAGIVDTPYAVAGLQNDRPYTFAVVAVNSAGRSAFSWPSTATPSGPPTENPDNGGNEPTENPDDGGNEPTENPDDGGNEPTENPGNGGGTSPGGHTGGGGGGGFIPPISGPAGQTEQSTPSPAQSDEDKPAADAGQPSTPGEPVRTTVELSDIAEHWAEINIKLAVAQGILTGYPDGTFKPDNDISRAEFLVMLTRFLQLDGSGATLSFTDQDTIAEWSRRAVALAVQAELVYGYEDGSFRPGASMNRAELAVMIARALKLPLDNSAPTSFADDNEIPLWAKGAVRHLHDMQIVSGKGDMRFSPNDRATRAEAVSLLLRMLEHTAGGK